MVVGSDEDKRGELELSRMRNNCVITMCVLVGVLAMVSCAPVAPVTPHSLRAAKGTGLARVYAAPPTTVWNAVPTVLSDLKLKYIGEDTQAGYLLAESNLAAYGTGELVVVFLQAQEHTRNTRVEVIAKKVNPPGLFAPAERNWAADILNQLDDRLKRLSGH